MNLICADILLMYVDRGTDELIAPFEAGVLSNPLSARFDKRLN